MGTGTTPGAVGATCRVLLVGGSLRSGSTNAAVLKTVQALAPDHVAVKQYQSLAELPHFNPDDDREPLPPAVATLRALLAASDAVLFSTPEYAGTLPGAFKNLLDWTVGGGLYGKPVGYINASAYRAALGAHETLRVVLGYVSADLVEASCVQIPVPRDALGADGLIADATIRVALRDAITALALHAGERARSARPAETGQPTRG